MRARKAKVNQGSVPGGEAISTIFYSLSNIVLAYLDAETSDPETQGTSASKSYIYIY